MKKNIKFIGYIALTFLLTIFFLNLFLSVKTFSKEENRTLASKPKLQLSSIIDGSYFSSYNKYLEDQFWNKATWKSLKTKFEKFIGLKKIDNIYFGNNKLIEETVIPNEEFLNRRINNIKKLNQYYQNLNIVLIPNKIGIYYDEIDSSNVQKDLYDEFTSNFSDLFKINSFDVLINHKEEDIFYKTDHHYTTKSALYISEALYNKKIDYSKYIVNNSFYGTNANKIGYYNYSDTVELYIPNNDIKYYLTYNNEDTIYTSIYDKTKQYSYNPYEIFFGGNKSIIDIKTTSKNKEKLLLIKDSYANSFVPFILEEYQEIIIIDPRYYHNDLNNLINDKEITNIMLFYNMNTFFEDSSLDDLIENLKQ